MASTRLLRQLEQLGSLVESKMSAVCRRHELSHAALNALAVIEGLGQPVTPTAVGKEMHITSGSITSLLDTLEKRDLVRRSNHRDDRRKVLVELTPAGEAVLDQALPETVTLATALVSGLTEAERNRLAGLLTKMAASVARIDEIPVPAGPRRPPHRPARARPAGVD